jgi:hypothetical protein
MHWTSEAITLELRRTRPIRRATAQGARASDRVAPTLRTASRTGSATVKRQGNRFLGAAVMWIWIAIASVVAVFVGFAWVTK